MADEDSRETAEQQRTQDAATGGLGKKLFAREGNPSGEKNNPGQGVAHIPATVLTVEYVDDSEGMDAALKDMNERLQKMQEQIGAMQETQAQLIAAVNQQARNIGKYVESVGRRIDQLYKRVAGGEAPAITQVEMPLVEEEVEPAEAAAESAAVLSGTTGLSAEVADDPDHQNAWRIARVLAADLEAYHEDAVKEGVLYGTFHELLGDVIEKARSTYEQRVPQEIVDDYDYFSKALEELIGRKKMELDKEEQ